MDYPTDRSVPFKITNINHGLQEAKGLMRLNREGIELEFEVRDSFIGLFKSGIRNIHLSYADLEDVELEKGWFSAKIIMKGTSMKVFREVPGTEQAVCTLKVKRAHRKDAENLISRARLYLSEYRLNQLGEG